MFNTNLSPNNFGIPQLVTLSAAILIFEIVILAQPIAGAEIVQTDNRSTLVMIAEILTAAGLIFNAIWAFWNHKNYTAIRETVKDQKELLEAKEKRIDELKLQKSEAESRLNLQITNKETTITGLKVSNSAVVSQNLQMKAILKKLRLSGSWEGHEDELHVTQ